MRGLDGKRIVVTGAGNRAGMGYAAACSLLEYGARVVMTDHPSRLDELTAMARETDPGASVLSALSCDVTDTASIEKCFEHAAQWCGGIDGLFNNAGVGVMGRFDEADLADLDKLLAVNTRSVATCMQAVLPYMRAAGGGSIVNNVSQGGLYATAHFSLYESSKFAVAGLSKAVALEVGGDNIRVNIVCPGAIETDMGSGMTEYFAKLHGISEKAAHEAIAGSAALGRWGQPGEVAQVVCFLLSDLASYITGSDILVSGGSPAALA